MKYVDYLPLSGTLMFDFISKLIFSASRLDVHY